MKKAFYLLLALVAILFINGCYFVFDGQFKATDKVNNGQDLSTYETFSAYTMHTACWMFGWVVEPTTAKLAFCSQFHIVPKRDYRLSDSMPTNDKIRKIKRQMTLGDRRRLAFKAYTDDASLLLNGSTLVYAEHNSEANRITWRYEIPMDYKPGIVTIAGFKISETLFDYLERKHILQTFDYIIEEAERK